MMISREELKKLREKYPAGTRIRLISMNDKQAVPPNTLGTVSHVDDIGGIKVRWDNHSALGLTDKDLFVKVKPSREDFFIMTTRNDLFHIMKGTGGNLLEEDIEEGFVDYICYDRYKKKGNDLYFVDGGMAYIKEPYESLSADEAALIVLGLEDLERVAFIYYSEKDLLRCNVPRELKDCLEEALAV